MSFGTKEHREFMARQARCSHKFIVVLGRTLCRHCGVLQPWDVKELPRSYQ